MCLRLHYLTLDLCILEIPEIVTYRSYNKPYNKQRLSRVAASKTVDGSVSLFELFAF